MSAFRENIFADNFLICRVVVVVGLAPQYRRRLENCGVLGKNKTKGAFFSSSFALIGGGGGGSGGSPPPTRLSLDPVLPNFCEVFFFLFFPASFPFLLHISFPLPTTACSNFQAFLLLLRFLVAQAANFLLTNYVLPNNGGFFFFGLRQARPGWSLEREGEEGDAVTRSNLQFFLLFCCSQL